MRYSLLLLRLCAVRFACPPNLWYLRNLWMNFFSLLWNPRIHIRGYTAGVSVALREIHVGLRLYGYLWIGLRVSTGTRSCLSKRGVSAAPGGDHATQFAPRRLMILPPMILSKSEERARAAGAAGLAGREELHKIMFTESCGSPPRQYDFVTMIL